MNINVQELEIVLKDTLSSLLGQPFGSQAFYILFAAGFIGLVCLGKLLNSWIGGSSRGFLGTTIGLVLPCVVAVTALAMAKIYVPEYITNPDLHQNAQLAVAAVLGVFTLLLITPFFLGTGVLKSATVFVFTLAAVLGIANFTAKGLESLTKGQETPQTTTAANYQD